MLSVNTQYTVMGYCRLINKNNGIYFPPMFALFQAQSTRQSQGKQMAALFIQINGLNQVKAIHDINSSHLKIIILYTFKDYY